MFTNYFIKKIIKFNFYYTFYKFLDGIKIN